MKDWIATYHTNKFEMCVCTLYVPLSLSVCVFVCMICLGERLDGFAQFFLKLVGEVQESVS